MLGDSSLAEEWKPSHANPGTAGGGRGQGPCEDKQLLLVGGLGRAGVRGRLGQVQKQVLIQPVGSLRSRQGSFIYMHISLQYRFCDIT